jgi:hypothetical protein
LQKASYDASGEVRDVSNLCVCGVDDCRILHALLTKSAKPGEDREQPLTSAACHEVLRKSNGSAMVLQGKKDEVPTDIRVRLRHASKAGDLDAKNRALPGGPDTRHASVKAGDGTFSDPRTGV